MVTVTNIAVTIKMFIYNTCHCILESNVCMTNPWLMLWLLYMLGQMHVQSHMFLGIDCINKSFCLTCVQLKLSITKNSLTGFPLFFHQLFRIFRRIQEISLCTFRKFCRLQINLVSTEVIMVQQKKSLQQKSFGIAQKVIMPIQKIIHSQKNLRGMMI